MSAPRLHSLMAPTKNTKNEITHLLKSITSLACMAGVKRGRGMGNLGARGLLPPPSRVVSRLNSLPLLFRTPATQAIWPQDEPNNI